MEAFKELSMVRLINTRNGVPAGTLGTVVYVYNGGEGYEVEFVVGDTSIVLALIAKEVEQNQCPLV